MVSFTADTANPLANDDEVVVTVPVPAGYTVVPANGAGDPLVDADGDTVDSRTFTFTTDNTTGVFILRVDPVNIAPTQVDLQMRPDELEAMKDPNTDGGRTKIDLEWNETYSDNGEYAEAYRIQWSTNPDASEWELLADVDAMLGACNAARECTHSDTGLFAGEEYSYRIFAKNADETMGATVVNDFVYSWSAEDSALTTDAEKPGSPRNLRATRSQSDGHTEIDLSWQPPIRDDDGVGDGDGFGVIVKYVIEQSDDRSDNWESLVTLNTEKACSATSGNGATHKTKSGLKPISGCTYTHMGLMPGQTLRYRVATVNIGVPEKTSDWSDTATLTTQESTQPDRPEGLVAEAMGRSMINLMWNIQSRTPPAAPIIAYIVEYLDDDVWMEAARITDADAADNPNGEVRTIHTDAGLPGETTRTYRVLAQNMPAVGETAESAESERATTTTAVAVAPDAPTGVEAMTASDTEITVTWVAPADNGGAAITGYMVERGVMGADSMMTWTAVDPAHTDTDTMYMDMGLMLKTTYYYRVSAMNSVGTGDMSDGMASAMTYRTNTAPMAVGTIADMTLKADQMSSGMDVSGYFNDDDMGDTLTYTASSDMTTYATVAVSGSMVTITGVAAGMATITVTATDLGVGAGMMNPMTVTQTFMVTVEAANVAPMAGAAIDAQTVTAGEMVMVATAFTDADMDTLTYMAMSDMEMYATATVDDMGMVTITGVAAGMATITVTATDIADATATQDIMVTVEAADTTLTAPSGVVVSTLAGTQSVSIVWDTTSIQNAQQIKVVLFNSDVTALAKPLITINPANDAGSATFNDVPDGTYYVTVASFRTGERHNLSPLKEVTVE